MCIYFSIYFQLAAVVWWFKFSKSIELIDTVSFISVSLVTFRKPLNFTPELCQIVRDQNCSIVRQTQKKNRMQLTANLLAI